MKYIPAYIKMYQRFIPVFFTPDTVWPWKLINTSFYISHFTSLFKRKATSWHSLISIWRKLYYKSCLQCQVLSNVLFEKLSLKTFIPSSETFCNSSKNIIWLVHIWIILSAKKKKKFMVKMFSNHVCVQDLNKKATYVNTR